MALPLFVSSFVSHLSLRVPNLAISLPIDPPAPPLPPEPPPKAPLLLSPMVSPFRVASCLYSTLSSTVSSPPQSLQVRMISPSSLSVSVTGLVESSPLPFYGSLFALVQTITAVCGYLSDFASVSTAWTLKKICIFYNHLLLLDLLIFHGYVFPCFKQDLWSHMLGCSQYLLESSIVVNIDLVWKHESLKALVLGEFVNLSDRDVVLPCIEVFSEPMLTSYVVRSIGNFGRYWFALLVMDTTLKTITEAHLRQGAHIYFYMISYHFVSSALMAEAITLKTAMEAASLAQIPHITLCSDAQVLVNLLNSNESSTELKCIQFDTRCLLLTFASISFVSIPRSANELAVSMAKHALGMIVSPSQ